MNDKSLIDYGYDVLSASKDPIKFIDLFNKVVELSGAELSESELKIRMSKFYTQLSLDERFITLTDNFWDCLIGNWPLYFCDVPIYIIPLAALTKGRFKQWCLDFMAICGLLMGFMGNYFFSVINALLNHSISAFVALFIWVSGLNKMEKRDIPFAIGILFTFMSIALTVDYISIPIIGRERNFMFFFNGDGTPFTLFLDLYKGALIPYQITIYVLQCGYMGLFYLVYYWIMGFLKKREEHKKLQAQDSTSSN